jgi:hypothetical protein
MRVAHAHAQAAECPDDHAVGMELGMVGEQAAVSAIAPLEAVDEIAPGLSFGGRARGPELFAHDCGHDRDIE